jgi:hypothetical protein
LRWRKEYERRGEEAFTEKQPFSREEALQARIALIWGKGQKGIW